MTMRKLLAALLAMLLAATTLSLSGQPASAHSAEPGAPHVPHTWGYTNEWPENFSGMHVSAANCASGLSAQGRCDETAVAATVKGAWATWNMNDRQGVFKLSVHVPRHIRRNGINLLTGEVKFTVSEKRVDADYYTTRQRLSITQKGKHGWRIFTRPVQLDGKVQVKAEVRTNGEWVAVSKIKLVYLGPLPQHLPTAIRLCADAKTERWLEEDHGVQFADYTLESFLNESLDGAIVGAAGGAAGGSVVPGIGTVIGAVGGFLIGFGTSFFFGRLATASEKVPSSDEIESAYDLHHWDCGGQYGYDVTDSPDTLVSDYSGINDAVTSDMSDAAKAVAILSAHNGVKESNSGNFCYVVERYVTIHKADWSYRQQVRDVHLPLRRSKHSKYRNFETSYIYQQTADGQTNPAWRDCTGL